MQSSTIPYHQEEEQEKVMPGDHKRQSTKIMAGLDSKCVVFICIFHRSFISLHLPSTQYIPVFIGTSLNSHTLDLENINIWEK